MRIHRLDLTAFGPFAAETTVDFDALSEAGLFLLTGATGAGKTSILDAVCFALYGAVPGDRQAGKRLRSDQAADGVAPEVTLELTVTGRRFRITRSPAWTRPKRRGTGTTTEQARVVVAERVDGSWSPLTTRLDEAGHLVSGMLGMTVAQFCQVQLLPQGRFQAFLRAGSDERHRLLQQLFHASRFEDVERWLRDRRRSLRRESSRHHDRVASLVSRISEVAARPLPDAWDPHDLVATTDELEPWGLAELRRATAETGTLAGEVRAAEVAEATARARLEAGRQLAERLDRVERARTEQQALLDRQPEHHRRLARRDAARRAAAVLPVCDEWQRAEAEHRSATVVAGESSVALARVLDRPEVSPAELPGLEEEATAGAARARALLRRVHERSRLATQVRDLEAERQGVLDDLARLDTRAEQLPAEISSRREAQVRAQRAADGLPAARRDAEEAAARLAAARELAELRVTVPQVTERHRASIERAQALREEWLDLRERRITGMAAEIAGALVVGASCPVCGSADHPCPAEPAAGTPDAEAERVARRAVDDAETERLARSEALTDLETRIARVSDRAGDRPVPALEREAADRAARLDQLVGESASLDDAGRLLAEAEAEQTGLLGRREKRLTDRTRLDTSIAGHRERMGAIDAEVAEVLDDTGFDSVAALADHLQEVADLAARSSRAARDADRSQDAAHRARRRACEAAGRHGFSDPEHAARSALSDDEVTALDEQVRHHESRLAAVTETLADPVLAAVAATPAPDLPELEAAHRRSDDELGTARARHTVAARRVERLQRLRADLAGALDDWRPVREQLGVADGLATLADGSSADNRLRMRLSGYVLAFRLGQVVAAANERLVAMTDQRYRLEHTGDRGAGETRGGLSLRVRDDWSGEARDPVTLSGGETFVVSLALALGLADVVAHEAGGVELDTLFVDEGFGTLDAETLDDVMDTLDSLRDGGRVVGVVSHVAEMRDRIPSQLQVRKHPSGSTIRQDAVR